MHYETSFGDWTWIILIINLQKNLLLWRQNLPESSIWELHGISGLPCSSICKALLLHSSFNYKICRVSYPELSHNRVCLDFFSMLCECNHCGLQITAQDELRSANYGLLSKSRIKEPECSVICEPEHALKLWNKIILHQNLSCLHIPIYLFASW